MTAPTAPFPVPHTRGGERGTDADRRSERGSARFTDIAALLAGGLPHPPKPLLLTRDDGHAVFYAGQVNFLFGDAESGKTLIALAAISEIAKADRRAAFIDIDHNGVEAIVVRLVSMGVPVDYLSDPGRFRYVEPEDKSDLLDVVAFLRHWRPAVVVVDSVGELLPLFGLNSNSPDDFTAVHAAALKPLAQAGAAVVAIDHLAKNAESKAAGPTGTAAKRRAVTGVSIRVKINEQFVPGHGGSAWLTVNKDRHGGLRQHCPLGDREPSAGLFVLTASGHGDLSWNIRTPKGSDAAQIIGIGPGDLDALSALDPPPKSVQDVKDRLHWRSERAGDALRIWRQPSLPRSDDAGSPFPGNAPGTQKED